MPPFPSVQFSEARETAEQAVRSGLRHILFANRPEWEAQAIDAYLRSMKAVLSPLLVNGRLSQAAQRGKRSFNDPIQTRRNAATFGNR